MNISLYVIAALNFVLIILKQIDENRENELFLYDPSRIWKVEIIGLDTALKPVSSHTFNSLCRIKNVKEKWLSEDKYKS